jgi:Phosphotransferase enzyme family
VNTTFRDFTTDDAAAHAAASLSRTAGELVAITDISVLGEERRRNHVIRAVAQARSGNCQGIVIKATRAADHDASSEDAATKGGIGREWAAASVLDPESANTARFLAGDAAAGVVVFSDLGADAPWLATPLLHGSASEAEAALLAYAISLGRLHATTVGCHQSYVAEVQAAFPRARVPRSVGEAWLIGAAGIGPSRLGGVLPEAELELLLLHMRDPGRWLVLVHGDACPDNVLLTAQGAALLDFEFAAPGHSLFDAAYWRMGFPTCWCAGSIPDPVAERIEQAYRATVADAILAAHDTAAFRLEYAAAVVVRLFGSLEWHLDAAFKEDSTWGIATLRNRILWHLQSAIEAMERAEALPGSCRTARAWLTDLRQRWPDVQALPLYPAFARSAAG